MLTDDHDDPVVKMLRGYLNPNKDQHDTLVADGVLTEETIQRLRGRVHEIVLPLLDSHEALRRLVNSKS